MPQDRILIKFQAKGDTALERSILKIAKAQAILEGNSKKLALATNALNTSSKKLKKGMLELSGSQRLVNTSFATFRSKLLLVSFAMGLVSQGVLRFVNLAAKQQEIVNKFNVVFGKNAEVVQDWAESYGDAVGRATSDMMGFLSTLQDTFVPLGFTREYAADLSQSLTQLALDVASFNDKSDADVIRDFQSALVGNHETVRKYGIVITQTNLELEALQKGIIDTDRELTNQEKLLARASILFGGAKDAINDLQRTQDSYQNRLKALQGQWKEASEDLGHELMPAASKLMDVMVKLIPVFKFLSERVVELGAAFLLFKSRIVATYVTMKIYNAVSGLAAARTAQLAIQFKTFAVRSGVGILVVAIGEIAYQLGLFSSAADDMKDMGEVEFEMPEFKLPEPSTMDKFIRLNDNMDKALWKTARGGLTAQIEALEDLEFKSRIAAYTSKAMADATGLLSNKGKEHKQHVKDLAKHTAEQIKYEDELLQVKEDRNRLDTAFQNIVTEREKYTLGLLPAMEHENKILQKKIDFSDEQLELELLKLDLDLRRIPHTEVNLALLKAEIKKRAELTQEIKDQTKAEKAADALEKSFQKTRENNLKALTSATVNFATGIQDVAKNFRELGYIIEQELRKIVQTFLTNQILFSLFGIGSPQQLFGTTLNWQAPWISQEMHSGGMIPQSYHSGGDVPIVAQEGEFVMQRSAVESMGVENLNRMNRTGQASGGVNVTFSGNVMSRDFIENEAIPKIKDAIRRGADIGIS